jgi:uncharacterized membrane protein (DUF485 family)
MPAQDVELGLKTLSGARWRVALSLTAVMLLVYFGFILLTAFEKTAMGHEIAPGLSVGILLGATVIVVAFVLTGLYVRWANAKYDPELREIQRRVFGSGPGGSGGTKAAS